MSYRKEALKRLVIGPIWLIIATVFIGIVAAVSIVVAVIDIAFQLITNDEIVGPDYFITWLFGWYLDGLEWVLTGKEEANLLSYHRY